MKRLVAGIVAVVALPAAAGAAAAPSATSSVAAPHVIFVWFADGQEAPAPGICGAHPPPPYQCSFAASTKECQARIMRELAGLYRDFDVQLVTANPAPAPHFTVVVTSADASWCKGGAYPSATRGLAPVNCAAAGEFSNTAYAFACDRDAATCARRIAQEQAHLVGLDHADNRTDVMYPFETASAAFRDRAFHTLNPRCGRPTQNSHQLMLRRFGPRRSRDNQTRRPRETAGRAR